MTIWVNSIGTVRNNFECNIYVEVRLNTNTSHSVQNLQGQSGLFFVNLSILRQNSWFDKVSGLVSPSASIHFVGIYTSLSKLLRISSQTLWNCMSISLIRGWLIGLMASLIADWLAAIRSTMFKSSSLYPGPFKLPAKNTDSFATLHSPIYTASAVEFTTVA